LEVATMVGYSSDEESFGH
jgi:hypothetical protein